jgi:hypothetical protein
MIVNFLNVPEEDANLGEPAWEEVDILEIGAVWNAVEDASEVEDTERRRVAAAQKSAPKPSRTRWEG